MTPHAELIRSAQQGDPEAEETLIAENSGLIWSVARRFFGRGVEPDDLYQLGCIGLIKAIKGFDAEYGTQFSTYAVPKISGEMRRFLRDDGAVKVSRTVKERALIIRSARSTLEQRLGREPFLSELSEETGFDIDDIATCESAVSAPESLQRENGEDGCTLEQILCDLDGEARLLEHVALKQAVEKLSEKEKKVVVLRFYHGLTQQKSADILGISQVQVSRTEAKAVRHLREMME